jgi:hypothetical protein
MAIHKAQSVVIVNDPGLKGSGEVIVECFTCPHCGGVFPFGRQIGPLGEVIEGGESGVCHKHMRYVCRRERCQRNCHDYLTTIGAR